MHKSNPSQSCFTTTFKAIYIVTLFVLYSFFWVNPQQQKFMCWHFTTLTLFHFHRWCKSNRQSVLKHQHIKFRCRGVTQKKEYSFLVTQYWSFTHFVPKYFRNYHFMCGLGAQSVYQLTTGWTVRDRIPVGTRFSANPDWSWGPPSLLYNGYQVFPGGKVRSGRAADHSPLSSAAVMEEYSYTSTHPLGHTGPVTGSLYLSSLYFLASKQKTRI